MVLLAVCMSNLGTTPVGVYLLFNNSITYNLTSDQI